MPQAQEKVVIARSGNRCAYPECGVELTLDPQAAGDQPKAVGKVAHIAAASPGGPRYDEAMRPEQRGSADNLIYLCGPHHDAVDAQLEHHTLEFLADAKRRHEEAVARAVKTALGGVTYEELSVVCGVIASAPSETARRLAARSPGARLDPPVLLALDEIGNLAPLPSLPVLMAEGGGTGLTVMPVLQSMAQARNRWGENAATAIWDASIAKIVLGGASGSRDLQDLSTLIGDRDETTDSVTIGERGLRSNQRSTRRVPIMPPDVIRTLPYGTALVLLRSAPPIVTRMREWTARPDAAELSAQRAGVERLLRRG